MTLYCAIVHGVKNKYADPNIDTMHFANEDEAKEFIVDEYEHRYGINLDILQIEIFERASQRQESHAKETLTNLLNGRGQWKNL